MSALFLFIAVLFALTFHRLFWSLLCQTMASRSHIQARRYIYLQRGLGWASWLKAVKLQPFSGWAWPGDAKASNWAASVIYSCQAVHHHHHPGTSPIPMPISQSSGSGRVLSRPLLWFIYATPSWADSHVALTLH